MEKVIISRILKDVFGELTKDSSEYFDWYGFKTTEIFVKGTIIGIGIRTDSSAIKLFTVNPDYKKNDSRRFSQSFRIGRPDGGNFNCWSIETDQTSFQSKIEDFSKLSRHFSVANKIIQMIDEYTQQIN